MSLLHEIESFLRRSGMRPSRFGRLAANDPKLVESLRDGRVLGAAMEQRVRAELAAAQARLTDRPDTRAILQTPIAEAPMPLIAAEPCDASTAQWNAMVARGSAQLNAAIQAMLARGAGA